MRNALFLAVYVVFVAGANLLLKLSSEAAAAWPFIALQVAGNLAGFVAVLAYTGMMRTLPLHIAFPLSRGFSVLAIQGVVSVLVFHEVFRPVEIAGVVLVAAGIILVGIGAPMARVKP
jgi:multidrug resistance protein EbrB